MVQLIMKYIILTTEEFEEWLDSNSPRSRVQIAKRLDNIKQEGHFGDHKAVGTKVSELRWENGRRIYYTIIPIHKVLLLLGGNKNGQSKDISQAEKIYKEWVNDS